MLTKNPQEILFDRRERFDEKAFFQGIHHLNGDHRLNNTFFDFINKNASLYLANREVYLLNIVSLLVNKELLRCPDQDTDDYEGPFASRILLENLSDLTASYIKKLTSLPNEADKQDPTNLSAPDLLKEEKMSKKNHDEK